MSPRGWILQSLGTDNLTTCRCPVFFWFLPLCWIIWKSILIHYSTDASVMWKLEASSGLHREVGVIAVKPSQSISVTQYVLLELLSPALTPDVDRRRSPLCVLCIAHLIRTFLNFSSAVLLDTVGVSVSGSDTISPFTAHTSQTLCLELSRTGTLYDIYKGWSGSQSCLLSLKTEPKSSQAALT